MASGSITITPTSTSNNITGRLNWSEGNFDSTNNTRPVTLTLQYKNPSSYETSYTGTNVSNFYIKVNGTTVATKTNGATIPANNSWVTILTYTYTATYPDSGQVSLTLAGGGGMPATGGLPNSSGSAVVALTSVNLATNCGAPSSVTVPTIVKPTGSFTISWSGATGGTNNSITGQDIYWRITSAGSAPTTSTQTGMSSISTTASSVNSFTIAINNQIRAYKIVCGIVTKGSAGSNYQSNIKTSSVIIINSLPTITVSANKTIVASTGENVTFTASASDINSQTLTLQYATTNSSSSSTQFSSPLTLSINATTTYYFWAYDGLEYSSVKTVTIAKNEKPTITANNSTVTIYTALGNNGTSGSRKNWANNFTPKLTFGSNKSSGTVSIKLFMKPLAIATTSTTLDKDHQNKSYNYSNLEVNSTSIEGNVCNVDSVVSSLQSNSINSGNQVAWRVMFTFNDGIEDSDSIYFPTDGFYSIAPPPSIAYKQNQFSTQDIDGTTSGHMYDKVRLCFYNDSSATTRTVTAVANNVNLSLTMSQGTITIASSTYRYINVTLTNPSSITSGATITFNISLTNNNITKTFTTTMTMALKPTIGSITYPEVISPFQNQTINGSIGWPFGASTNIDNATADQEISSINFQYNSKASQSGAITISNFAKDGDLLKWTVNLNRSSLFGNSSGTPTYYIRFIISNKYGQTYATDWLSRKQNLNEPVTIGTASVSPSQIREGNPPNFSVPISYFTAETLNWILYRNNEIVSSGTEEASAGSDLSVQSLNLSCIYSTQEEITQVQHQVFELKIIGYGGTVQKTIKTFYNAAVVRHTAPDITLSNCTLSNNNFNLIISTNDNGYNTELSSTYNQILGVKQQIVSPIDHSKSYTDESSSYNSFQSIVQLIKTDSTFTSGQVCLKVITTITINNISTTKETYSNVIIIYSDQPTVSYRKNHLGINTDSPDPASVLDIHLTTGIERVCLHGEGGIIYIYPIDGIVGFTSTGAATPSYLHLINLDKGTLN